MSGGQVSARNINQRRSADPEYLKRHRELSKAWYDANRQIGLDRKKDRYHQRMATLLCSEVHAGVMY